MTDDLEGKERTPTADGPTAPHPPAFADRLAAMWRLFAEYLGTSRWRHRETVASRAELHRFLETRASFMAQTSLYGYLRTRAGMRYPELFDNDEFVASINIAKWQVWLACLADLAAYTGGLLATRRPLLLNRVGPLIQGLVDEILAETGVPGEAGPEFAADAESLRARLRACNWAGIADDESAFTESPAALVRWAPIVDELKQLDEAIVKNSVRFRWQEVRRDLRRQLDADAVLRAQD